MWKKPFKDKFQIKVWDHHRIAGYLDFLGPKVLITGNVKMMLKHVRILSVGRDGKYFNYSTELKNDPLIINAVELNKHETTLFCFLSKSIRLSGFSFT